MSLWTVARLSWADLSVKDRVTCMEWISGLGQDPTNCMLPFVVTQDERDRSYQLHLSRYVLDEHGKKQIDHAADHMWTEPVVIPIAELPAWLLPAYSKHLAEQQNGA